MQKAESTAFFQAQRRLKWALAVRPNRLRHLPGKWWQMQVGGRRTRRCSIFCRTTTGLNEATLKQYLTHMTRLVAGVGISTRNGAMCAHHIRIAIFQLLVYDGLTRCKALLNIAVQYVLNQRTARSPQTSIVTQEDRSLA